MAILELLHLNILQIPVFLGNHENHENHEMQFSKTTLRALNSLVSGSRLSGLICLAISREDAPGRYAFSLVMARKA